MNGVTKYKTDRKWVTLTSFFLAIILIMLWTSPNVYDHLLVSSGITISFIITVVWSLFGLYVTLNNKEICHINYFFVRNCLDIKDIDSIYYQPSWSIGEAARSLNIIDLSTGEQRHISLPNLGFSEKTLAQIAQHLKQLNPSTKIDEHTEMLIKKHGSTT